MLSICGMGATASTIFDKNIVTNLESHRTLAQPTRSDGECKRFTAPANADANFVGIVGQD